MSSPLKSVPSTLALGQGCLVFPSNQGSCSTDSRAGFQQEQHAWSQELTLSSRPNSSETVAWCSSVNRFGVVLCSQLQPVLRFPNRDAPCALWDGSAICTAASPRFLELRKPAVTDLRKTTAPSALSTRVMLPWRALNQSAAEVNISGVGLLLPLQGNPADTCSKEIRAVGCRQRTEKAAPLRAVALQHPTMYSISSDASFHFNQEQKLFFLIPLNGTWRQGLRRSWFPGPSFWAEVFNSEVTAFYDAHSVPWHACCSASCEV